MKYLWLIITLLWFLFMTYLSHQNGTETAQTSLKLAEMLGKTGLFGDENLNGWLRKVAHVVVFAVLGLLVSVMLRSWDADWRWVVVVFLWAIIDEWTKIFIDGRHFVWCDVGLNEIGSLIGRLIGIVVGMWICR